MVEVASSDSFEFEVEIEDRSLSLFTGGVFIHVGVVHGRAAILEDSLYQSCALMELHHWRELATKRTSMTAKECLTNEVETLIEAGDTE